MSSSLKISPKIAQLLVCPVCRAKLEQTDQYFICQNPICHTQFPITDGIPVLINEQMSVFSFSDFVSHGKTYFDPEKVDAKNPLRDLLPSISNNVKAKQNYQQLGALLQKQSSAPRVLVIGGGILGQGMQALAGDQALELVETDISFGPRTMLFCDAHDIPFEDESFDGVIAQAVLEHVTDPYRVVEEIYRVLKKDGLIYAETPFMQQVHGGRYDFTRFTHLGHRRLFRKFDEIESGAVSGPGMALAWSFQYFLLSFFTSKRWRLLVKTFAHFTAFWLKYFDSYLIDKSGTLDAASGYYFIGRKSAGILPDRELIKQYRGAI